MSLKSKIAEFAVLSVLKWCVIILFAGIILYFVMPKYEMVREGECLNKITGRLHPLKSS